MPTASDLLTASKIAKELSVSDAKVKKAITALGLKPAATKGVCAYYDRKSIPAIKKALA